MAAPAPFATEKLIRFHHCDPAGIVFYPQYFVLINELVEDWFDQGLGIDFARLHGELKRGVPVRRLECDFLSPSRIGERLTFTLALTKIGGSSLTARVEAGRASSGSSSPVRRATSSPPSWSVSTTRSSLFRPAA